MIKYKLFEDLWQNDMEIECFQRKTLGSDKIKYFALKTKKSYE